MPVLGVRRIAPDLNNQIQPACRSLRPSFDLKAIPFPSASRSSTLRAKGPQTPGIGYTQNSVTRKPVPNDLLSIQGG